MRVSACWTVWLSWIGRATRRRDIGRAASTSCGSGRAARPRRRRLACPAFGSSGRGIGFGGAGAGRAARRRRALCWRPAPAAWPCGFGASLLRSSSGGSASVSNCRLNCTDGSAKAFDRLERHHQPLRHAAERQADLEGLVGHLEIPELVLQDDGHFLRVLRAQRGRQPHALGGGVEGDEEMMLAGQARSWRPRPARRGPCRAAPPGPGCRSGCDRRAWGSVPCRARGESYAGSRKCLAIPARECYDRQYIAPSP